MRALQLRPLTAEAFAPYGDVVEPPELGGQHGLSSSLGSPSPGSEDAGTSARLSFSNKPPSVLPLVATEMERHPWSSQTFVPVDVSRWVVMVAPDLGGRPNPDRLCAFVVRGDQAVNYHVGTWHHPLHVLDRPGRFAVLMWTTGRKQDDETWSALPEPVRLWE